jgi:putative spermidine/putrescine transport system permease protein
MVFDYPNPVCHHHGYSPVMASVAVLFIAVSVLVFGLIGRFGDLPKLLGAWSAKD